MDIEKQIEILMSRMNVFQVLIHSMSKELKALAIIKLEHKRTKSKQRRTK